MSVELVELSADILQYELIQVFKADEFASAQGVCTSMLVDLLRLYLRKNTVDILSWSRRQIALWRAFGSSF